MLMDLLNVTADHDRRGQAAHRLNCQSRIVVEFASGIMTLISTRDSVMSDMTYCEVSL